MSRLPSIISHRSSRRPIVRATRLHSSQRMSYLGLSPGCRTVGRCRTLSDKCRTLSDGCRTIGLSDCRMYVRHLSDECRSCRRLFDSEGPWAVSLEPSGSNSFARVGGGFMGRGGCLGQPRALRCCKLCYVMLCYVGPGAKTGKHFQM